MSVLSEATISQLIDEEKAFLHITWHDPADYQALKQYTLMSAKRLERIYGGDINWGNTAEEADCLAHELLLYRVFYMREHALDDFEDNFRGELMALMNMGRIKNKKQAVM